MLYMFFFFFLVEMFNVHVEEVIQAGLVPRFVEFLTWDDFPQLQVSFHTCVRCFITAFTRSMFIHFMEYFL